MRQIQRKINWLAVTQFLLVALIIAVPAIVSAQGIDLPKPPCPPGLPCSDPGATGFIGNIINWLLSIAFGVAVLFLIIGGFWYITSAGNEENAEKGKKTVINAIIGLIIIILSYVIVNVVVGFGSTVAGG